MLTYLCQRNEIQDPGARGFVIGETRLFVVQQSGQVFVYRNRCPHLGIELEWLPDQFLDPQGELIQCATHGALFIIETGVCIAGPCTGDALEPLPFREQAGAIFLLDVQVA